MMVLWWWLALAACTNKDAEETGDQQPDPATVELAGPCEMADDFGGFVVQSAGDNTGVQGAVADGVVPITIFEEIGAEGDCQLLRQNNPFCEPACDVDETCDFDGTCIDYPRNQDLGIVTIRGLVQSVEMEAVFPGNTYYDTSLPDPPYVPGELVALDMPEGTYGPATLYGVGLAPHATSDAEWVIDPGSDLAISWDAPTGDVVRSEIAMSINIDQHGASPGTLVCTFEDTGSATVPAGILQQLIDAGVTGFPTGALDRRTADHADIDGGCMDLVVTAPLTVPVDVVGYTPCVSDADCPDGETCNIELQICEPE